MEKEDTKEEKHDPQEVLEAANEVFNLAQAIKTGLERIVAIPEILNKIDQRLQDLNKRSHDFGQQALASKKEGNTKDSLLALKKKKLVDEEVKKMEIKRAAIIDKAEKETTTLLSDPLYVGLKNAASDIKLGKRGKYKKETVEEVQKELADYYVEASKEDEAELMKELEELES